MHLPITLRKPPETLWSERALVNPDPPGTCRADGDVRVHNGGVGRVTTTDGRDVHLRTFVKLTVEAGVLEIQQLIVDYGG